MLHKTYLQEMLKEVRSRCKNLNDGNYYTFHIDKRLYELIQSKDFHPHPTPERDIWTAEYTDCYGHSPYNDENGTCIFWDAVREGETDYQFYRRVRRAFIEKLGKYIA